jgi:spore coat protein A
MDRRRFLETTLGGVGLLLPSGIDRALGSVLVPQTPLLGAAIPKYTDPLFTFFGSRVSGTRLTASMEEFQQRVLPSSFTYPAPFTGTYVWGYRVFDGRTPTSPHYPAFTIEARRHLATRVFYVNNFPIPAFLQRYLTLDQTIHWANPLNLALDDPARRLPYAGPYPLVTHLHGAEVPSDFDGVPDQWFTRNGIHGAGYRTLDHPPRNAAIYEYPNHQEATGLWFHDHALGVTRLDVFAGLEGLYLLRDPLSIDNGIPVPFGLPAGPFEVELILQDRQFDTNGQWFFPDSDLGGLNGGPPNPDIHPFWIPEFFGDAMVVNGNTWPYFEVEPRRYRFRLLNASNARFLQMKLVNADTLAPGPPFWVIGTDGGLLDFPAKVNDPAQPDDPGLLQAPAERYDVIIDFAPYRGQTFILTNSANAPFPGGDPPDPDTTAQIMQFRVNQPLSSADLSYDPARHFPLRRPMVRLANPSTGAPGPGITIDNTRQLVLIEIEGDGGPIEVLLNNTRWNGRVEVDGMPTGDPVSGSQPNPQGEFVTELPRVGSTEVWEIANLTEDAHPIHIHLIQFQLLSRQDFDADSYRPIYDGAFPGGAFIPGGGSPLPYLSTAKPGGNPSVDPFLMGTAQLPPSQQAGWKDTLIMYPGQMTRIAIRWAPQSIVAGRSRPGVNQYAFDPTSGPGYVWHCHILDHEDNEMMRPYSVTR